MSLKKKFSYGFSLLSTKQNNNIKSTLKNINTNARKTEWLFDIATKHSDFFTWCPEKRNRKFYIKSDVLFNFLSFQQTLPSLSLCLSGSTSQFFVGSFCSFWPLAVRLVILFKQALTPARWSSEPAASFISSSSLSGGFSVRRFFSGSVSLASRSLVFRKWCRFLSWGVWQEAESISMGQSRGSFLILLLSSSSVSLPSLPWTLESLPSSDWAVL